MKYAHVLLCFVYFFKFFKLLEDSSDSLTHLSLDKMAAISQDDIFRCIFMNEKFCILIQISLKFVPNRGLIDNNQALV